VAADELGMSHQCRDYLKSSGYKWHHLIPDIVLKKPSILFTKNFWSTTLFTKTYHPRIDFENTDPATPECDIMASFSFSNSDNPGSK